MSTATAPRQRVQKSHMTAISCRGEFRRWLQELAQACSKNQADTIAEALALLAERQGFRAPPARMS